MRYTKTVFALLLALAVTPAAAKVQLVTNGDFTDLTNGLGQLGTAGHPNNTTAVGWTNLGYNFVFTTANDKVPQGSHTLGLWTASNGGANTWNGTTLSGSGNFVAMDGDYSTGAIKQTINGLTVGDYYSLTFNYAFGQQTGYSGATIQSLGVAIGGDTWNSGDVDVASHGFSGWDSATVDFKATSTSEVLSFLAKGNLPVPPFALVSDVSIEAVPEPATWAMMMLGFAGLGFAGFRSTKRKAAFAA